MSMSSLPTTVTGKPLSALKDSYKYVVVGAGPSGLAAASALLNEKSYVDPSNPSAGENGEKVLAEDILMVEKHYAVGGVWRGDGTGHVWPGMRTNLSREKVSFSLLPRDKPPVASTLSNNADPTPNPLAPGLATDSHLTEACVEERDRAAEEEEEAERAAAAACNVGYCTAPQGTSPSERAGRNTRSRILAVTNTAEADTGDDDNHDFPTGKAMYRYFVNYAHRSGVKDCVLFGTNVVSVRRLDEAGATVTDAAAPHVSWEIHMDVYPVPNSTEVVHRIINCEKLIVASGVFSKPFAPVDMVKSCEGAGIEYVHSADFRRGAGSGLSHLKVNGVTTTIPAEKKTKEEAPTATADGSPAKKKKYLVIGAAYSGADISVAIEDGGDAEVEILAPRAPKWYVPRYLPASATSATLATAATAAAALGGQLGEMTAGSSIAARHGGANRDPHGEYVTWDRVLESRCGNKHDEHLPYLESRTAAEKHAAMAKVPGIVNPGTVDARLAIDVVKHPMQTVITTEKFLRYIREGRLKIIDTPSKEEGGICAAWLKSRGYDIVLFATGYRCDIEYFDEYKETFDRVLAPCGREWRSASNNDNDFLPLVLYKATLHPHLNDIAFVGMCRGPYLSTIDVQARWAARVLRGLVPFPDDAKREHYVSIEKRLRETRGRAIMRPVEDGIGSEGGTPPISPTTGLPAREYRVELDKHPNSFPHSNYIAFTDSIAEEFGAKPLVSENPDYEGSNVVASMYVVE